MLAGQLPDGSDDSPVLECLREIVLTFRQVDMPEPAKAMVVMLRTVPDLNA
jgi:hypothetical protein